MKYLIAQGNSRYNVCVVCKICKKEFTWLKLYKVFRKEGEYLALCSTCAKRYFKKEFKESKDNINEITVENIDGTIAMNNGSYLSVSTTSSSNTQIFYATFIGII